MLRTVVQGICGVFVANVDVLVGSMTISPNLKPVIVALCMAILSPIMAELGRAHEKQIEEGDVND